MSEFHSEQGQDRWLVENVFGDKRGGVFVEAGAIDGLLFSNTLHFEREKGWTGVLIEGLPAMLGRLSMNRPRSQAVGCALASSFGVAPFECVFGSQPIGWSGLVGTIGAVRDHEKYRRGGREFIPVQTRTLAAVLTECDARHVDYLSLDVEGSEFDVLSVFPFAEFDIDVIGVEDNSGANEALRTLLASNGYRHLARVGVDEFWRRGA